MHEVKGQGPDHESACHLRRGKRQTAANGVAAKIQTETIKKLGPMSGMGPNRTCRPWIVMSALLRLTDSSRTSRHVRKVPNSRHRAVPMNRPGPRNGASSGRLHAIQLLVGIQQRRRNCEAEYLRDPLPPFNNISGVPLTVPRPAAAC